VAAAVAAALLTEKGVMDGLAAVVAAVEQVFQTPPVVQQDLVTLVNEVETPSQVPQGL
jgi:hypothetical protein